MSAEIRIVREAAKPQRQASESRLVRCAVQGCEARLVPDARPGPRRTLCSKHFHLEGRRERAIQREEEKPPSLGVMIRRANQRRPRVPDKRGRLR